MIKFQCPICTGDLIEDTRSNRRYCDTRSENPNTGHYYIEKKQGSKVYEKIYFDHDFVMSYNLERNKTWINQTWAAGREGTALDVLIPFGPETRVFLENFYVVK